MLRKWIIVLIITGVLILIIGGLIMFKSQLNSIGINPELQKGVVSASGELSNTSYLKDLGYFGMEIVSYKVNNEEFVEKEYSSVDFDFISTIAKVQQQKYTVGDSVSQEIYINNKLDTKRSFNTSILIQIGYDKITWNGNVFYLKDYPIDKPLKLGSWINNETGNLITPNIFFNDVYNKRIGYKDVAEQGGYALAYQDNKINYIELIIKDKSVNALESSKIDPTYANQTDGFTMVGYTGIAGPRGITTNNSDFWITSDGGEGLDMIFHTTRNGTLVETINASAFGSNSPLGITNNGSDFWIADNSVQFVFHLDKLWNNLTNGFFINASGGVDNPTSITTNLTTGSPTDFWFADDTDNFMYHVGSTGTNKTGGFSLFDIGSDRPYGITTNNSDFWIMDGRGTDLSIYHTDKTGVNQTDAFKTGEFGANNPFGMTSNVSNGGAMTDFWIVNADDKFVYHLACSGADCGTPAPPNTCTYSSGNWAITCSDNCTISSNVDGAGSSVWSAIGKGNIILNANITDFLLYHISGGCNVTCAKGCINYN